MNYIRHGQNGGLELGMFCKLPQTASSAPQSAACILLSKSPLAIALAKQSDEEISDGVDGQNASCPLSVDGEAPVPLPPLVR